MEAVDRQRGNLFAASSLARTIGREGWPAWRACGPDNHGLPTGQPRGQSQTSMRPPRCSPTLAKGAPEAARPTVGIRSARVGTWPSKPADRLTGSGPRGCKCVPTDLVLSFGMWRGAGLVLARSRSCVRWVVVAIGDMVVLSALNDHGRGSSRITRAPTRVTMPTRSIGTDPLGGPIPREPDE
jgi:hypothetical protein